MLNLLARFGWPKRPSRRKRTTTIRRITAEECERFSGPDLHVEDLPPKADTLITKHGLDDHFRKLFAQDLTHYRFHQAMRGSLPSKSDHVALLREIVELSDELALRLQHLPTGDAEAYSTELWRKANKTRFGDFCSGLTDDLFNLRSVFAYVADRIEKRGGKAGRKEDWPRNNLIGSCLELLGCYQFNGDRIAFLHNLLQASSVYVPADLDDFKKAARAIGKAQGST